MAPRQAVTALLLIAVVGILLVGLSWAQPSSNPEPIDRCQAIDEPGEYRLTEDLEWRFGECLRVHADNVTIDGDGHTISGGGGWLAIIAYGETTLRDLTIEGAGGGVDARAPTTLERVTIRDSAIGVRGTGTSVTLTVVDSTVAGGQYAISHIDGELVVRETAFEGAGRAAIYVDDGATNVTVESSRFANNAVGLATSPDYHGAVTIVETAFDANRIGIQIDGAGSTHRIDRGRIVDNERGIVVGAGAVEMSQTTVDDNDEYGVLLDGLDRSSAILAVEHSELSGQAGPAIGVRGGTASVRHAVVRDNRYGLRVEAAENRASPTVSIADSTIAGNTHGVEHAGDDGVVDARQNFWGAPDGPSSEGYLEDPETGGLAAGGGDSISSGADGTANVAFDPFLDAPEGDAVDAPTDAIYGLDVRSMPLRAAPGEEITIAVEVTNTLTLEGDEQIVALDIGGTGSIDARESIQLDGGESASIEFVVALPHDPPQEPYTIVVSTAYDAIEVAIHVEPDETATDTTALETPTGAGEVEAPVGIRSVFVALSIALGSILVVTYLVARRHPMGGPRRRPLAEDDRDR